MKSSVSTSPPGCRCESGRTCSAERWGMDGPQKSLRFGQKWRFTENSVKRVLDVETRSRGSFTHRTRRIIAPPARPEESCWQTDHCPGFWARIGQRHWKNSRSDVREAVDLGNGELTESVAAYSAPINFATSARASSATPWALSNRRATDVARASASSKPAASGPDWSVPLVRRESSSASA